MAQTVELWERPESDSIVMIAGWRQWADAGAVSSGLPEYLIRQTKARQIGKFNNDGFYLFQIPGTHDLVRPAVRFVDGYPEELEAQENTIHYVGSSDGPGVVIFLGDEPHMDIERYVGVVLDVADELKVKRIVSLGGVYGELPYDKERTVSALYSLPDLHDEVENLAVILSDYEGGASIGSYLARRAGDRNIEMVGLYAFVPTYDFSSLGDQATAIRIENDYMAWLGVVRRLNYMLKTTFATSDLERKGKQVIRAVEAKIDELDKLSPELGVREYLSKLSLGFSETTFDPLDDVWETELRRLFDADDDEDEPQDEDADETSL